MRKTDKASRTNKPIKSNLSGGGIGTLKQSKEELAESKKVLKTAQKLAKNKKIISLLAVALLCLITVRVAKVKTNN